MLSSPLQVLAGHYSNQLCHRDIPLLYKEVTRMLNMLNTRSYEFSQGGECGKGREGGGEKGHRRINDEEGK